jgi:hypothetical protein
MSYKKWIYKYKYLKAEVDEINKKMEKYCIEFNKLFITREKYEQMKNNPDAAPIIEEPKPKPKEINNPGKSLYKDLSKKLHPDKGGNEDEFIELSEMYNSKDILGMYIKAEELGIEIDENSIEDIEHKFQESCNILSKQIEEPQLTAAWVWGNTPEGQKQQVIEKFENAFGIILKEKLKANG